MRWSWDVCIENVWNKCFCDFCVAVYDLENLNDENEIRIGSRITQKSFTMHSSAGTVIWCYAFA